MGEDVDFFSRGANPNAGLVLKLQQLDDPPHQPRALAAIIERRCGHALDFGLHQHDEGYAALRRRTHDRLVKLKGLAAGLLQEGDRDDQIWPYTLCLDDLLAEHVEHDEGQRIKAQLIAAVASIASLPVRSDLQEFRRRPRLSPHVREIVRAVAEYWTEVEQKELGGGVDRKARSTVMGIKKGSAASLAAGVLSALSIKWTPSQLETHMRAVREEVVG